MIGAAVSQIAKQLNQHLKRTLRSAEDVVVMSNVVEQDGSLAKDAANRLLVFVVNIEKDASSRRPPEPSGDANGRVTGFPPVLLNLHVMLAAHFPSANYAEALKLLSAAIQFFQGRPILDHANSPDLDPRIARLVLDIENLDIHDLSNLWGVLSGRYLPSVLYKVRLVAIDSGDVRARQPVASRPRTAVGT